MQVNKICDQYLRASHLLPSKSLKIQKPKFPKIPKFNLNLQMLKSKSLNLFKHLHSISTQIKQNSMKNHHLILRTPSSLSSIHGNSRVCFCSSAVNLRNEGGGVSLVQGASRGIGLEFVKQLLERNEKGSVIATCRNPDKATGLLELKKRFPENLEIQQLDVTDESTIEASADTIKERYGSLNLLINASGILAIPNLLQPETTLSKLQKSSLLLTYEVNTIGPIMVIKHMWPLLKAGGSSGTDRNAAIVANVSARVSSIGDNRLGGWHSYRSSKTALNQLTKNVSLEFARRKDPIICILLHPGTVDTDLSKPFQRNVPANKLFTKEFSVQKLLGIIDNVKSTDNGKFFAWDGQEIPW